MEVVVIRSKNDGAIRAIVESPFRLSTDVVANQWAKSQGYNGFPLDCVYSGGCNVMSFSDVMLNNTSYTAIEQMQNDAREMVNNG